MLCSPKAKLDELIVSALAAAPGLTVPALQAAVTAQLRRFSIPALYQELRKLRDQAVVVKVKDRYSLRLGWVLSMIELTDSMYDAYVGQSQLGDILPPANSKRTWHFTNLRALGAFAT